MQVNLLPIGTVIILKNSSKRIMIIGLCQEDNDGNKWDYAGCYYPEGLLDADKIFLFNNEQIDEIFYVGYQDEEQFEFVSELDIAWKEYKGKNFERWTIK